MFSKSLDEKKTYIVGDNIEVVDLGESIFDSHKSIDQLYSIYKVSKDYEMRPDLISRVLYGTTDFTEMILKYSMVNNPFAMEYGDIIYAVTRDSIYHPIKDVEYETTEVFDAIKNYHKYIDKNKVPKSPGSDTVPQKTSQTSLQTSSINNNTSQDNNSPVEANITKTGDSGITIKDGKIYFGSYDDVVTNTDSPTVDCAVNGTTLGEFLNATLRNS